MGFHDRAEFSKDEIRDAFEIAMFHLFDLFALPADEMVVMLGSGEMAKTVIKLAVF